MPGVDVDRTYRARSLLDRRSPTPGRRSSPVAWRYGRRVAAAAEPLTPTREPQLSRHSAVDPSFGARLRQLRRDRGLSLRGLAGIAYLGKSYIQEMETGQKLPPIETARQLDRALDADGELVRLIGPATNGLWTPDDEDRLLYVARQPRRIDVATVESLTVVLAHQRRLEDSIGSAPLLAPVTTQASLLADLVRHAPDDDRRPALVDTASQWAHFAGWLAATTGDHPAGREWYMRATEWATEAGNPDMVATTLSMRGHQAWVQGQLRAVVRLSQAAGWQPASTGVRALAVQQEARGLAMLGDATGSDSRMGQAEDMAREAAEHPEDQPPSLYFYSPDYLGLQQGLADVYLGRYERAIETLTANLERLPPEIRQSDWVGWYVLQLAIAYTNAGDHEAALQALEEARRIAQTTAAARLGADVERQARLLGV